MPRWLKEIQIHLQELHERTSSPDDDIPLRLQEILKSRFAYLEDINPVQLARFMDPRFHQLVGIPEAIVRGVEENICQTTQLLNPTAPPELILGHVNQCRADFGGGSRVPARSSGPARRRLGPEKPAA